MNNYFQKPTKEIAVNQDVYSVIFDCIMKIKNIRVDSSGEPIFTLEDYRKELSVARFCEIMEIY
jgi:hypothetical protein